MDVEKTFDDITVKEQDKRAKESLRRLDNFLNSSYEPAIDSPKTNSHDYLSELEEEDNVKIEDLRNLIAQLEEMKRESEIPDDSLNNNSQNNSQSKGKTLTKSLPGIKNSVPESDNTAKEIASSFISCFILCMVTALMGTGWFLYIINHI